MRMKPGNRGLTLVELISVMAILAAVMAVSAPRLSGFFSGRTLVEETRRFLAVTRYARSEAVSQSVLMDLSIDPATGVYKIIPQVEYSQDTDKHREYTLADNLRFEIEAADLDDQATAHILFWPDGTIDESSLTRVVISKSDVDTITIVQSEFGMGYAIEEEETNE